MIYHFFFVAAHAWDEVENPSRERPRSKLGATSVALPSTPWGRPLQSLERVGGGGRLRCGRVVCRTFFQIGGVCPGNTLVLVENSDPGRSPRARRVIKLVWC